MSRVTRWFLVMIADRIAELGQHLQAAARDAEPALDRLVGIGHAAHHQHLRLPLLRVQLLAQQRRRVFLDQDLRLEVEPRGEAEVLVRGAREAVDAAVLAAAIRIDAGVEADVRTVVRGDDRPRRIAQVDRARRTRPRAAPPRRERTRASRSGSADSRWRRGLSSSSEDSAGWAVAMTA